MPVYQKFSPFRSAGGTREPPGLDVPELSEVPEVPRIPESFPGTRYTRPVHRYPRYHETFTPFETATSRRHTQNPFRGIFYARSTNAKKPLQTTFDATPNVKANEGGARGPARSARLARERSSQATGSTTTRSLIIKIITQKTGRTE